MAEKRCYKLSNGNTIEITEVGWHAQKCRGLGPQGNPYTSAYYSWDSIEDCWQSGFVPALQAACISWTEEEERQPA